MRKKILFSYGLAIILGVLTGLAGTLFQLVILTVNQVISLFLNFFSPIDFFRGFVSSVLSILLVLTAWILVKRFAPEAAGSGVQEIEGVLLHVRPIEWRHLLPIKFIGGVLAICAKMVVGREGPMIQMGGNLGAMLSEVAKLKKSRKNTLIAAGAAAGLATAFNAPLAGVLFVVEELRNSFNYNFTNFKMIAICCVISTLTSQMILGSAPALPMTMVNMPEVKELWIFFIFGIWVGLLGLLFNHTLINCLYWTDKLTLKQRIAYIVVISGVVGLLAYYYPLTVGGGYEVIEQTLSSRFSITRLIGLFGLRFIMTITCYTLGVPGGIFAPMLALGTLIGLIFFYLLSLFFPFTHLDANVFAVAGMGALFSAAIRAPLTGIVLVVEMTGNYFLIFPLMICCLTSTTIMQLGKNQPIYTQLLRRTLKLA